MASEDKAIMNFALPDVDWNDVGKSITRVCFCIYTL